MADKYSCFAILAANERKDIDYKISIEQRNSTVAIIAPHGGKIEPMTTELAGLIAEDDCDLYSFMGIKKTRNRDLRITSHHFDEPSCLDLIASCDIVVAIHGREDKADRVTIYLGGLDIAIKRQIEKHLAEARFSTQMDGHPYPGTERRNICNRGRREMGIQLELPRSLREALSMEEPRRVAFAKAVRSAIICRIS